MTRPSTLSKACATLALAVVLGWPAAASAQKLIFVVRHAERADGGAGAVTMNTDPPLSAAGAARATKLAAMLGDASIGAIYVTEYRRTRDTAKPLADKLKLSPVSVPAGATADLVAKIQKDHASDIVLIVGHSNTLPEIIKAFGGPAVTIGDSEYDNLFVIAPATKTVTRIRF